MEMAQDFVHLQDLVSAVPNLWVLILKSLSHLVRYMAG